MARAEPLGTQAHENCQHHVRLAPKKHGINILFGDGSVVDHTFFLGSVTLDRGLLYESWVCSHHYGTVSVFYRIGGFFFGGGYGTTGVLQPLPKRAGHRQPVDG